jgi:hypothetical protein
MTVALIVAVDDDPACARPWNGDYAPGTRSTTASVAD